MGAAQGSWGKWETLRRVRIEIQLKITNHNNISWPLVILVSRNFAEKKISWSVFAEFRKETIDRQLNTLLYVYNELLRCARILNKPRNIVFANIRIKW